MRPTWYIPGYAPGTGRCPVELKQRKFMSGPQKMFPKIAKHNHSKPVRIYIAILREK